MVLLHGLGRSSGSMDKMEEALANEGYKTCNISYPSTEYSIKTLVADHVLPDIQKCFGKSNKPVSFVTHSMGGIITRALAAQSQEFKFGRVVMLSPPNQGSEVIDKLGGFWVFGKIVGPAGLELGTDKKSTPNTLGPPPFEFGVITGNQSINLFLSTLIEGDDDGKVSIEQAKEEGMSDFLVIPATHPFIMKNSTAIRQVFSFLNTGHFKHAGE